MLLVYLVWLAAAGIISIRYPSLGFLEALGSLVPMGAARLGGTTIPFYLVSLSILTSLSGLVTGIISLFQIKKNQRTEAGSRIAITGICLAIPEMILELISGAYLAFLWFILGLPM